MYRDQPKAVYLKDYRPPEFVIDRVDLHFDLSEDRTRVRAELAVRRNPVAERGDGGIRLDGEQLELRSVALDGRALSTDAYTLDAEGLYVKAVPDSFRLVTEVRIYPQQNTALEGLYKSGELFCTQCEAEGFRRITYFLDRPDVMARYTTTLVADRERYPVLLSNGNPVESGTLAGGRHWVRWEDPFPKPSYLFALVVGDLQATEGRFTTASGREVVLRLYTEAENVDKCAHALGSLQQAMRWDEEHYGREYDLDIYMIVAVKDFNMGAMENKGLNIFNAKYVLARPETATDSDFQHIEGVIAHEYFHNWTGNRITCRDWFQLSLKEGFTVFRDQEFSADMGSRGVKRIQDVRALRAHQFAEDAGPMAHPVRPDSYMEINNFYTTTVYEKGAEVVRMQANLLGPTLFRKATDLYFQRYDGRAVTTDDFVACMEQASGRSLTQFKRWYSQAGTPQLRVEDDYDATTRRYTLRIRQHTPPTPGQPEKQPFHIPFAIGLLDADGNDLPLRLAGEGASAPCTRFLELSAETETFRFVDLPVKPVPSLLRGFSAPVKVLYDFSDEDLRFLMARDRDGFNRWEAAQALAQRVILGLVEEPAAPVEPGFGAAFREALLDEQSDPSLLAEVLTLPSESYLGDQMEQVDVDGIHAARERVMTGLASALREDLLEVYQRNREPGGYDLAPASIGRRRLKNMALGYLMQLDDAEVFDLCLGQFAADHNMTDTMAALALLAERAEARAEAALHRFYERWQRDPLVLDKWFAVQALAKRPDTLTRVEALLGHEAFSIRNPNKVRSLIGAFAAGNPVRFH